MDGALKNPILKVFNSSMFLTQNSLAPRRAEGPGACARACLPKKNVLFEQTVAKACAVGRTDRSELLVRFGLTENGFEQTCVQLVVKNLAPTVTLQYRVGANKETNKHNKKATRDKNRTKILYPTLGMTPLGLLWPRRCHETLI
jgi:hypothetical protein